jgi:hypothetical protein
MLSGKSQVSLGPCPDRGREIQTIRVAQTLPLAMLRPHVRRSPEAAIDPNLLNDGLYAPLGFSVRFDRPSIFNG